MTGENWYPILTGWLSHHTGLVVSAENEAAVRRFVNARLAQHGVALVDYLALLERDPDERRAFISEATIHETYFFREEKYFHLLDREILPAFHRINHRLPVFWSAAAATGEEAFSIALLLRKYWPQINSMQIIASDIDANSLALISAGGPYSRNSFRSDGSSLHSLVHTSSTSTEDGVRFDPSLSILIQTREINLLRDDYQKMLPCRPDVIFLCNVLIYMDKVTRERVIAQAASVLAVDGYLFLSSANTALVNCPLLELQNSDRCYYFRRRDQ